MEVHHVLEQIIGSKDMPFAQRLSLGWVIIGEVCLERVHKPGQEICINSKKTHVLRNGRTTLFEPCPTGITVTYSNELLGKSHIKPCSFQGQELFHTAEDDNSVGLSVEDRDFLELMNKEMHRDEKGNWLAPLPFRTLRTPLPNNRSQAEKRAEMLGQSWQSP